MRRRGLPACTTCHGATLTGTAPFVPGLVGLPRDYLNAQLGAWRNGKRLAQEPDCMAAIAKQLDGAEIGRISTWLAAQPVPAGAKPAAGFASPMPLDCGGVPKSAGRRDAVAMRIGSPPRHRLARRARRAARARRPRRLAQPARRVDGSARRRRASPPAPSSSRAAKR